MNSQSRHSNLRRRSVIQKRQREKLNTIANLLDDLLWSLDYHQNSLTEEDSARLLRISTVLKSISLNRGTLHINDYEQFLGYQVRELDAYLSETSSWHTCPSDQDA